MLELFHGVDWTIVLIALALIGATKEAKASFP